MGFPFILSSRLLVCNFLCCDGTPSFVASATSLAFHESQALISVLHFTKQARLLFTQSLIPLGKPFTLRES